MTNKKNSSFIAAIANNLPLEVNNNDQTRAVEKEEENPKIEVLKKIKSKNNLDFIHSIINNYNENVEKTNESRSILINPSIHYKIKTISLAAKVNLSDLTNSILYQYFDENKNDIDALIKKMTL